MTPKITFQYSKKQTKKKIFDTICIFFIHLEKRDPESQVR